FGYCPTSRSDTSPVPSRSLRSPSDGPRPMSRVMGAPAPPTVPGFPRRTSVQTSSLGRASQGPGGVASNGFRGAGVGGSRMSGVRFTLERASAALLAAGVIAGMARAPARAGPATSLPKPVPVILDTDIGPDVDDVGAVAVLNALADNG